MDSNRVTVVYKWTAQPGKLDELSSIYSGVVEAMRQNEPGAKAVHVYASEADNAVYVRDEFTDAGAMGFHLSTTAAAHFGATAWNGYLDQTAARLLRLDETHALSPAEARGTGVVAIIENDADGKKVVDLLEADVLLVHLLPDGVYGLGPSGDIEGESRILQCVDDWQ